MGSEMCIRDSNTSELIETDIKQPVEKKDLAVKDEAEEVLDDGLY